MDLATLFNTGSIFNQTNVTGGQQPHTDHMIKRNRQQITPFFNHQNPGRDQRHGQTNANGQSRSGAGFHHQSAMHPFNGRAHHIQPHAPAGNFGNDSTGREARLQNQRMQLGFIQGSSLFTGIELAFHGLLTNGGIIQALAVVGNIEGDPICRLGNTNLNLPDSRFSMNLTLIRRFNAMINGIAQQVHEGRFHLFDDAFIDHNVAAAQMQINLLPLLVRQIVHHARKELQQRTGRKQAEVANARFDFGGHQIQTRTVFGKSTGQIDQIVEYVIKRRTHMPCPLDERLQLILQTQHMATAHHQFPGLAQQKIKATRLNAQGINM